MTEIDRSPAVLSTALSLLAGLGTLVALAVGSTDGAAVAGGGLLVLAIGLLFGSRRLVTAAGIALFAGVLVAGIRGLGPEPLFVGLLGAVLAWDLGENGIGVGEQLGREADTRRAEVVHAASSLGVGAFGVLVGYGAYAAAGGGQPVTALVFLLVGAVALVSALR